jgi:hypothetical protein
VGGVFALRHQLYWQIETPTFPRFLPKNSTFLRWVSGEFGALPHRARLNCWESIFAGAIRAGVVSKSQVADVYLAASRRGHRAFLEAAAPGDAAAQRRLQRRAAKGVGLFQENPELRPAAMAGLTAYAGTLTRVFGDLDRSPVLTVRQLDRAPLRAGDVVVYFKEDRMAHMALALGKRDRSGHHKLLELARRDGRATGKLRVSGSNISFGPRTTVRVLRPRWGRQPGQPEPRSQQRLRVRLPRFGRSR